MLRIPVNPATQSSPFPATQSGLSRPLSIDPYESLPTYHDHSLLARNSSSYAWILPASGSCEQCGSDQSDRLQNASVHGTIQSNNPLGTSPRCGPTGGIFMCFSPPRAFPLFPAPSVSQSPAACAGLRPPARATVRHPFPTCHSWNF